MPTIYCRHIRPSGRRCQCVALRGEPLCFHHASAKARLRDLHPPEDGTRNILRIRESEIAAIYREPLVAECYVNARSPVILDFPPLEDANAIQLALSMVLTVLGQNRLDPTRAASMLYNLQIASGNVRNVTHNESKSVRDIVQDDAGNLLSADQDPEEVCEEQQFLKDFAQHEQEVNKDRDQDDIDNEKDEDDF